MIGLFAILTLACLASAHDFMAPEYVQAKEQFTYAKAYLSENLPPKYYTVKDERFSFAILAGTLAGLADSLKSHSHLKPIEVVNSMIPYIWKHYDVVQGAFQRLNSEATMKTAIIINLIDNLCTSEGIDECNKEVALRVQSAPEIYGAAANLLLSLGEVGAVVNNNAQKIDSLVKNQMVIPYLINYANDPMLKDFVSKLVVAYHNLKRIQFRRLFDMD